jgi:hypothetical protein
MHNNPFHPEPRAARLGEIHVVCRGPVNLVVRRRKKGHKMTLNGIFRLLLLTLLLGSGCSSVTTTHPLSRDQHAVDVEKFEGIWLMENGSIHVKFTDNGVAKLAGLDWKENAFRVIRGEAIVTEGKKHNFLSVRYQEREGEWEGYFFLPYKFTDQGDLILWPPVPKEFERMVESKKLLGIVRKGEYSTSITITNAPGALLDVINDPDSLKLFEYRKPMVLKKIAEDD